MNQQENSLKSYFIDHMREGATCLADRVQTEIVGTYQDAVDAAHRIFKAMKQKQNVAVHSDKYCLYFWHYIRSNGSVEDRNNNSGVIFEQEPA